MALQCNITKSGRAFRISSGVLLLLNGVLLWALGVPGTEIWWRLLQAGFVVMGAFSIFEGAVGWCAVRAMGFRTRL